MTYFAYCFRVPSPIQGFMYMHTIASDLESAKIKVQDDLLRWEQHRKYKVDDLFDYLVKQLSPCKLEWYSDWSAEIRDKMQKCDGLYAFADGCMFVVRLKDGIEIGRQISACGVRWYNNHWDVTIYNNNHKIYPKTLGDVIQPY